MINLQHNKAIVVDGPKGKTAVCGSTNFSWRGFFVQSNNAVVVAGSEAIAPFQQAFEHYWAETPRTFGDTPSAALDGPRPGGDRRHASPSRRTRRRTRCSTRSPRHRREHHVVALLLARVPLPDARPDSGRDQGGLEARRRLRLRDLRPQGRRARLPQAGRQRRPGLPLRADKNVPPPFKKEPTGGGGSGCTTSSSSIDFDKPTRARLPGLVQLLLAGRHEERREPAADP